MNETHSFTVAHAADGTPVHGVKPGAVPTRVAPVNHSHHWSIYVVFASACLVVVGLASDPKVAEMVRSLLALR